MGAVCMYACLIVQARIDLESDIDYIITTGLQRITKVNVWMVKDEC